MQVARPAGSVFTGRDLGATTRPTPTSTRCGKSQIVTLASGENNVSVDAGVYYTARLGDKVWLDNNANGRQDAGEAGAAGVAVELIGGGADGLVATAADNVVVASVVTGADGSYQFTGLTPGVEYQVRFVRPDGSVFSRARPRRRPGRLRRRHHDRPEPGHRARLEREQHDRRRRPLPDRQPGRPRLARRQQQRPPGRGRGGRGRPGRHAAGRRRRRADRRRRPTTPPSPSSPTPTATTASPG